MSLLIWFISNKKKPVPLLGLSVVICILLWRLFLPGVPATHDGENHLARMANFYLVVKDGQFPPRWAPNLNYQYGYPVFHYNYYLPYIPGVAFYVLTGSFEFAYKAVVVLSTIIGSWGLFAFLRKYLKTWPSVIGSLLYFAAPPFLLQIFVRGNFGSIVAWSLFPLGLWVVQSFVLTWKKTAFLKPVVLWGSFLSLLTFIYLLSHQVLFIFAVPVWFLFGLVLAKNELQEKYFCKSSLLLGAFQLLGVLMGVYFIVPAVAEIDLVTLPRVALSQNFTDHFVYFTQFIWSKWGYQFSEPGIDDGMSFHLGLPQLTILLLGLALSLSKWIKFKKRPKLAQTYLWGFFAALLIMSVFLMLPVSEFFWLSLTFLKKIQFPWRILFLPSLSLAVLGAFVLSSINKPKMVAGIGLIVLVYGLWFARPGSVNQHDKYFYLQFPFTSSTQHENLPEGFDMNKVHEHKERLFSLGGEARFTEEIWKSNLHQYQIETTSDVTIVEHLAYFPGWEVYVNGQVAEVDSTNPEFPGVVTYKVSAGSHQVVTKWDENTTVRKVSDIVSLVAWVGLGIILYVGITMVPGRRWMSS